MKILNFVVAALIVVGSCASSNNNENVQSYPHLVELHSPGDEPNQPSKIYIDSVKQVTRNQQEVLVIHGTFPDGCTNLESVTHTIKDNAFQMEFKAWRNPEMMCTQVLSPFTFIYDRLTEKEISAHSKVTINNSTYSY